MAEPEVITEMNAMTSMASSQDPLTKEIIVKDPIMVRLAESILLELQDLNKHIEILVNKQ